MIDKDVCIKVVGFKPYFYVEIPKRWASFDIELFINALKRKAAFMGRNDNDYDASREFHAHKVVRRQVFNRFEHNNVRTLLLLQFDSRAAMRLYARALTGPIDIKGQKQVYERYEHNIEPILRFIHNRNIQPSGWIEIDPNGAKPLPEYSVCNHNYEVNYLAVHPKDMGTLIAPIKILSYDIECISGNCDFPNASKLSDKLIQIGMTIYRYGSIECESSYILTLKKCSPIPGTTVLCYKTERGLIKGFAKLIREIRPDIRTGYYISGFDDEYIWNRALKRDEVRAMKHGIRYQQLPDKIRDYLRITYGKLNLDYLKTEGVTEPFTNFTERTLSSSAMGENIIKLITTPGIIDIDMIKVIMRSHSLLSYSLDNVAANIIFESIQKFENNVIYTRTTQGLEVGSYIQVLVRKGYDESPIVLDRKYLVKGLTNTTIEIELEEHLQQKLRRSKEKGYVAKWTFAKDDMKFDKMATYFNQGNPEQIKQIAHYCLKDCRLVNLIIAKLCTVIESISMSNVCYVPMSYLFTRGQGIKIFSLVSKTTQNEKIVIPQMQDKDATDESAYYEGATVLTPKPGIYRQPIVTLDFNSLYPRCIQAKNLSPDTLVDGPKYDNLPGYIYHEIPVIQRGGEKKEYIYNLDGTKKIIVHKFAQKLVTDNDIKQDLKHIIDKWEVLIEEASRRKYVEEEDLMYIKASVGSRMIQHRDKLIDEMKKRYEQELESGKKEIYNIVDGQYVKYGILPQILTSLLNERIKVNRMMGAEKDPHKRTVLFSRQLALKITANSAYGLTGYPKSNIYCKPVAESTTACGRAMLEQAAKIVKEHFNAKIIYGDTDSIFIDFGIKDENGNPRFDSDAIGESIKLGKKAADLINSKIDLPHRIVYEKVFCPFIIVSKKKYAGLMFEEDPHKYIIKIMGLMLKRREYAPISKIAVGAVFNNILFNQDLNTIFSELRRILEKIINGKYSMDKYIITKTLRAHYENPNSVAHKVLANRMAARDPGSAPNPNDRIPYAFVIRDLSKIPKNRKILQGDMIEAPDYIINHNLKIDFHKYIVSQIIEPVTQFLELAVSKHTIIKFFDQYIKPLEDRQKGIKSLMDWAVVEEKAPEFVIEPVKSEKSRTELISLFNMPHVKVNGGGIASNYGSTKTKARRQKVQTRSLAEWC